MQEEDKVKSQTGLPNLNNLVQGPKNVFYIFKELLRKRVGDRNRMWPKLALYKESLQTSDLDYYKFIIKFYTEVMR